MGQEGAFVPVNTAITNAQDVFAAIVQTIFVKVGHLIDANTCQNIVTMVINMFKQHGNVSEAGLIIVQGLASGAP